MLQFPPMNPKPELFGTDGVRGVAGEYPLDPETVGKLGRALGAVLAGQSDARPLRVVLGEDTRESSAGISRALAAGLSSSGVEVDYAGVIPTPAVAFLTRHHRFAAGVMVSASHNPYQDNGIKIISSAGTKLPEAQELQVEKALRELTPAEEPLAGRELRVRPELLEDYLGFLAGLAPPGGAPRLVMDAANGAAARVLAPLMKRLGLEAHLMNVQPDGRNINLNCGSLHPEGLAARTRALGAGLGVAFDGDADRAIFATHQGDVATGDHVLFAAAPFLKARGKLQGGAVVGTLMTNLGLELELARQDISLKRTAVGDKYVLEEMLRSGINLGGEPSGHIIFADLSLAGDGLVTLLQVLRILAETGRPLEELVGSLPLFPQLIRNVRVREKPPLDSIPEVAQAIEKCRKEVGERGRVVVRYSGTERLARVMVEADRQALVERHAERIAAAIDSVLGAR
jgi:phosphoglucosamine mutase